jgi:hypothetical protein
MPALLEFLASFSGTAKVAGKIRQFVTNETQPQEKTAERNVLES